MKLALIQTSLTWEDPGANRSNFEKLAHRIHEPVDLIVLPEMFATGFTMEPHAVAENMDGPTAAWMKALAARHDAAVTGSLVVTENGRYYNRLLFVEPNGQVHQYDKRHLFSLAGENKAYTAGKKRLVVDFRGWKICPLVCYDLRFPVFSRNAGDYDLLLYVANWPVPRLVAWDSLLRARAIENMCYVAGVNRIGQDANGHEYPGHSQLLDFLGGYVSGPSRSEGAYIARLDRNAMLEARKKLGFLNDRDVFTLQD